MRIQQEMQFLKACTESYNTCKQWISLCRRSVTVDKIKQHTYICIEHFKENEVLDWKKNPSLVPIPLHRLKKVDKEEVFLNALSNTESEIAGMIISERDKF